MRKLGVIANCTKSRASCVLRAVASYASQLGLQLFADEETAPLVDGCSCVSHAEMFEQVDALMALGGDGTMLRAVRELDGRDRPVIGVNIGGLGFLTSVAEEELERAMGCLARDEIELSSWSVAESTVVRGGDERGRYRALNDVVVTSGPSTRVATLDVSIDGDAVTSYMCDGLIVCTPAGSTGHSLAAGGPIMIPGTAALVVSLICPHTLSSRPLVVPDSSEISVTVAECSGELLLTVDGQVGQSLSRGDRVTVRCSDRGVRFVHLPDHSYFAVLRQKLHWSGSNV